jgi:hypothetical protein
MAAPIADPDVRQHLQGAVPTTWRAISSAFARARDRHRQLGMI